MNYLDFDPKTRLFTALLRAGRQQPVEDAESEQKRKDLQYLLGQIWRAVGDERRAALSFASSGRTEPAVKMLQKAGEWQEVAELPVELGREGLVRREDDGREAEARHDVGDGEGLPAPGHPEEHLVAGPPQGPLGEGLDGRGLVPAGLEVGAEAEGRHGEADSTRPRRG